MTSVASQTGRLLIIAKAQAAIMQVGTNANPVWMQTGRRAAIWVCENLPRFTSDDIWEAMDHYYPHVKTHENRAMGALLTWTVRQGLAEIETCSHCGTRKVVTPSRRATANGTDTAFYRSLVH